MKQLIEKRNALMAEYDALKTKLEVEKRSAFTNEERTHSNEILIEIQDIDAQIETEKGIEAKRNKKFDEMVQRNEVIFDSNRVETKDEKRTKLESFLETRNGSFTMNAKDFFGLNKRSTITNSSDPAFIQANTHNDGFMEVFFI